MVLQKCKANCAKDINISRNHVYLGPYLVSPATFLTLPRTGRRHGRAGRHRGRLEHRHAEAEAALKRVVEIEEKADPDHQSGVLMNLGQHYASQKRY
ncbi:hypothetical protein [Massilia sp. Root351]|uniref:hypothetical protein n=1 Tax=Massilia sp. Root351 TaxID=1736522 RepID=UPI000A5AA268|nr:hypothetical protein [Massilia sp. Root351]